MSDHWRRLQHTFQCFQTKTCHAARRMKSFRKGHVTCQMLSIKTTVFSFVLYKRYPVGTSNISIKRSGKYSSDFTQNFAGGKNEYCCVMQMHGSEHMTFLVIRKRCCRFSIVQSFQFKFTTYLAYLYGKHSRSIDQKYNCHECWCYIIHIKWCFSRTNQLAHVLAICL